MAMSAQGTDMSMTSDLLDLGRINHYPVVEVKADGGSFYAKKGHADVASHSRETYATFPAEGQLSVFANPNSTSDFYITSSQVHIPEQLGIWMQVQLQATAAHALAAGDCAIMTPTLYWWDTIDTYYGGSLFTTDYKLKHAWDYFTLMSWEQYLQCAEPLNLEGNMPFQLAARNNHTIAVTPLTTVAADYTTYLNMASQATGAKDLRGAFGFLPTQNYTGPFQQTPTYRGGGSALSTANLVSDAIANVTAAAANVAPVITAPVSAVNHLHLWEGVALGAPVSVTSRNFYVPLKNWITQREFWLPHTNQRIRIRVTWTQNIMAVPTGTIAVPTVIGVNDGAAGALRFNMITPANLNVQSMNMYLKGKQFSNTVASKIEGMHTAKPVTFRAVIARFYRQTINGFAINLPALFTKQGFAGTFADVTHCIRVNDPAETAAYCDRGKIGAPFSFQRMSQVSLQDSSGLSYGVNNIPGELMSTQYRSAMNPQGLAGYLFELYTFDFSSNIPAGIDHGDRYGSQYMNGLWRVQVIPQENQGTGFAAGTFEELYEGGSQYANITQQPNGGVNIRYF